MEKIVRYWARQRRRRQWKISTRRQVQRHANDSRNIRTEKLCRHNCCCASRFFPRIAGISARVHYSPVSRLAFVVDDFRQITTMAIIKFVYSLQHSAQKFKVVSCGFCIPWTTISNKHSQHTSVRDVRTIRRKSWRWLCDGIVRVYRRRKMRESDQNRST